MIETANLLYPLRPLDYSVAGGRLGAVVIYYIALDGLIQAAPLFLMGIGHWYILSEQALSFSIAFISGSYAVVDIVMMINSFVGIWLLLS